MVIIIVVILSIYFLAPFRTNAVFIGVDYAPEENYVARSDTIVLASIVPHKPYIGILSIPRDLWVNIPGIGENRINTAHFFAEANSPGSGPYALMETIQVNFGIEMDYYVRIRFEGVREVINALGGVDLELTEPMAGYPAGLHHLNGNKALAFARHRMGSDDFFRMEQGQLLMMSIFKQSLLPRNWHRFPWVIFTGLKVIDTDLPWWQLPRLGLAILRAGPDGIDRQMVDRESVTPFVTNQGASVLLPEWSQILKKVELIFHN
ncbi:MAG: LCP family protein [Anaerolineales bacterium]|nr:MAG: LCP family protein [Anaerolineales bacterium]